jgi:lipopolysaccharide biosynthesis regulator YciM
MFKEASNKELCEIGEEFASKGQYEGAIKYFSRAYVEKNTCARAALGIAECYASKLELSAMSFDSIVKLKGSSNPLVSEMASTDEKCFDDEKNRMFGTAMDYYTIAKMLVIKHKDTSDLLSLRPNVVTECEEGIAYILKIMEKRPS